MRRMKMIKRLKKFWDDPRELQIVTIISILIALIANTVSLIALLMK